MAMLTTHAVQPGQKRSMPIAGAAISSSRVATAKRPARVSPEPVGDEQRGERGEPQPRVRAVSGGTPDSPPAPRVSSCQFFTTWSTTNSTASVIIVAASPPARATATPTSAPSSDGDERPRRPSPPNGPSSTSPSPNGRSGSARRLRRRRDRGERRAVGGDLGEGEVAERQDPGDADEHLQAEHEHEVDRAAPGRAGRAPRRRSTCRRARRRRARRTARRAGDDAAAESRPPADPSHALRGAHGEQPLRPDDEQQRR